MPRNLLTVPLPRPHPWEILICRSAWSQQHLKFLKARSRSKPSPVRKPLAAVPSSASCTLHSEAHSLTPVMPTHKVPRTKGAQGPALDSGDLIVPPWASLPHVLWAHQRDFLAEMSEDYTTKLLLRKAFSFCSDLNLQFLSPNMPVSPRWPEQLNTRQGSWAQRRPFGEVRSLCETGLEADAPGEPCVLVQRQPGMGRG